MRTAQTVLTVIQERGKQHKPIERVYKLLFNRDFYLNAYAKLYPNNGAMTKGVTDETVDGMSIQKIDRMIELLREEKYQWKPARREYIPKKNGKKRPLGIPTWGDKLLQEVMREILEAYYEPQFSNHSHGFRPNRGCHTALQEIQIWKGTRWFIEGDISKYFDTIDHDVLLKILEKNIHDGRFLRLISNMLKAGYLDDWKFNQTISGTPQGGVISPLLANIYLNEFDQWIENTLIPQYTKGKRQKSNPVYNRMNAEISKARKNGDMQTAHKLEVERRNIPSVDPYDENYRRSVADTPAQVNMSYGAVPFDLAAGTEQWWSIDSSDSAYWAVQENINAIRAAVGLSPLAMDGGLSAAADARCESFVAGGAFDHSGMTTRSEICAAGPIGSASSVCSYWQNSPAHYANIVNSSFTSMGVGCWFCQTAEGQYTYWTVTFN